MSQRKAQLIGTARRRVGALALFACGLTTGCSRPAPQPVPAPGPAKASALEVQRPIAPAPATANPALVAAPRPPITLPGDEQLPEPWRARFRAWLGSETKPTYVAVTRVEITSNAASVVLQRRTQVDGVCLQGPSKLDLIQYEGTPELTRDVLHFGDDCCPGTQCVRTSEGWNLHYLTLLADKNWKELSLLVPAKRKLVWTVNGGEVPTVELTRKQVAAGKLQQAPDCGLVYNVPSCDDIDDKAAGFSCRCDGGGYHVTYDWEREGTGFVLVHVVEESH